MPPNHSTKGTRVGGGGIARGSRRALTASVQRIAARGPGVTNIVSAPEVHSGSASQSPQPGRCGTRVRPDRVLADKAYTSKTYTSKANRRYLRRRGIKAIIPS